MTPHINAKKEDIAKTVIMPGDPLRAKFIAENFLVDYKLVNEIRGMLAYTGYYNNKKITVMGHGMGNPSIGIYSYELFKFYDVENIIRIGSCGSYVKDIKLGEIIIAEKAYSSSTYAESMGLEIKNKEIDSSKKLLDLCDKTCNELNLKSRVGMVNSSDAFYGTGFKEELDYRISNSNLLVAEMESFALYTNANLLSKQALAILSVSDSIINHEEMSPELRRTSFIDMMKLSLEMATKLN